MSRKTGVMQRVDGLLAKLQRPLDVTAALLAGPFATKRNALLRPVPVRVDAPGRRKRVGR
jgi:hypothetical protein